ncbi:hypothetical protein R4U68_005446 [Raoultella ornithinolytica]|nr:hypothetical protein [Raoultella ornithinolytica]HBU6275229.1 hypothetical protein [Klebsiella pneumoniae]
MVQINLWYDVEPDIFLPELLALDVDKSSFNSQSDFDDYIVDYLINNGYAKKTNLTWQVI